MTTPEFLDVLEEIIASVVEPAAADVDTTGSFPSAGIAALGDHGLLGLLSATEVGGMGGSLADASHVVDVWRRRAAPRPWSCACTTAPRRSSRAHGPATCAGRSPPAATSPPSPSPRPVRAATSGPRSARPAPTATRSSSMPTRAGSPRRRRGRLLRVDQPARSPARAAQHALARARRHRGPQGRRAIRRSGPAGQRLAPGVSAIGARSRRRPAWATTAAGSTSRWASCCRRSRCSTLRAASG